MYKLDDTIVDLFSLHTNVSEPGVDYVFKKSHYMSGLCIYLIK